MVDSQVVLWGQTLAYSAFAVAIMLIMLWFGINITKSGKSNKLSKSLFYTFVTFLVILGVSLHIIT